MLEVGLDHSALSCFSKNTGKGKTFSGDEHFGGEILLPQDLFLGWVSESWASSSTGGFLRSRAKRHLHGSNWKSSLLKKHAISSGRLISSSSSLETPLPPWYWGGSLANHATPSGPHSAGEEGEDDEVEEEGEKSEEWGGFEPALEEKNRQSGTRPEFLPSGTSLWPLAFVEGGPPPPLLLSQVGLLRETQSHANPTPDIVHLGGGFPPGGWEPRWFAEGKHSRICLRTPQPAFVSWRASNVCRCCQSHRASLNGIFSSHAQTACTARDHRQQRQQVRATCWPQKAPVPPICNYRWALSHSGRENCQPVPLPCDMSGVVAFVPFSP